MSRLGDLIRTERIRQKMTPKQVAKKCGVSESFILAVEAGTRIIADDQARRILNGAIRAGGTTIRSYTSSLGVDGRFQLQLKVHAKKGEPCPVCGSEIIKVQAGGRGTYYCAKCQKRR